MAHEARVRAYMARMEHSPMRRVRPRREAGASSSSRAVRDGRSSRQAEATDETSQLYGGETTNMVGESSASAPTSSFPRLKPGGIIMDTLVTGVCRINQEGGNVRSGARQQRPDQDGETTLLMQQAHKRKR